jgi:hypothetical protein
MTNSETNSGELPANASIGEVRAEIDNARHDAAKTMAVLADRFTISDQARRRLRGAAKTLSWDGRRVRQDVRAIGGAAGEAIPPGLADTAKNVMALLARLPMWVKVGVPALIVLRLAMHRRAK